MCKLSNIKRVAHCFFFLFSNLSFGTLVPHKEDEKFNRPRRSPPSLEFPPPSPASTNEFGRPTFARSFFPPFSFFFQLFSLSSLFAPAALREKKKILARHRLDFPLPFLSSRGERDYTPDARSSLFPPFSLIEFSSPRTISNGRSVFPLFLSFRRAFFPPPSRRCGRR